MSTNAPPAGGLLGIDDVLRVLECGGKGELDEHVSAGLHGADSHLGVVRAE